MAAVNRVKARNCTVVGYEVNDKVQLSEDVVAGDLLKFTGVEVNGMSVMGKAAAGATDADGMAIKDGYAGQRGFDVAIHGEADGFSGLVPGTYYYPSGAVAGGLDTVKPAGAPDRIKAVRTTRLRFLFV